MATVPNIINQRDERVQYETFNHASGPTVHSAQHSYAFVHLDLVYSSTYSHAVVSMYTCTNIP